MFTHDLKIPVVGVFTLILPKFNVIKRQVKCLQIFKDKI